MDDPTRANFLERNRKAAMKCRQKKKNYISGLEQKVETLTSENKQLLEQVEALKAQLQAYQQPQLL